MIASPYEKQALRVQQLEMMWFVLAPVFAAGQKWLPALAVSSFALAVALVAAVLVAALPLVLLHAESIVFVAVIGMLELLEVTRDEVSVVVLTLPALLDLEVVMVRAMLVGAQLQVPRV